MTSSQPISRPVESEVHVWHARLDDHLADLPWLHQLLSPDEQRRASRILVDRVRTEFCLSHGLLRLLLESYQVAPAAEIKFTFESNGKPKLVAAPNVGQVCNLPLDFNMSHAPGMAVFAFAQSCRLGIDVERVREMDDAPTSFNVSSRLKRTPSTIRCRPTQGHAPFFVPGPARSRSSKR
jgi:4'-phosphopantetheinyl transferase